MPNYFLDTSALAKLYHQETGSDYIDRILEQMGSRSLISRLSIVEFESVLAMKIRTGEIDQTALQIARRRFRADLARQRLIVAPPVHEGLTVQCRPEGLRRRSDYRSPLQSTRRSLTAPAGSIPHLIKPGRFLS